MPVLAVDGADIYYEVHGNGPPDANAFRYGLRWRLLDATSGTRVLARSHRDHFGSTRNGQNRDPQQ